MRITFLCQYFPPEMGAPAARTYEHARHWVRLGHEVTVVTGFPNHPTGIIRPEYRGYWVKRENVDGIDLLRTWIYVAPNKGFTRRVLNFLSFFFSSFLMGTFKTRRSDVVIGTSPQFFCAVSAYLLSVLKGAPFVFEVRDIWPQSAIELGALRNTALIGVLEAIEMFLYRRAVLIVAVAESTRQYLVEKGIEDSKIVIIPNGIDPEYLNSESDPQDVRRRFGLENKFVVSYIGTHGLSHALDAVLEAAAQVSDEPDIHFLFVGEGAEKQRLETVARDRTLHNVTFLSEQPRDQLLSFYRASNVGLVPLRQLPIFTKVLPSKLFELMGSGCAIICSVEGEAASLVARSGGGLCIPPEDASALVDAIRRMRDEPALAERMAESGREFVMTNYLRTALAERYIEELSSVLGVKAKGPVSSTKVSELEATVRPTTRER
jgi:glycosyltransferase involved in cell wall biosynthesis